MNKLGKINAGAVIIIIALAFIGYQVFMKPTTTSLPPQPPQPPPGNGGGTIDLGTCPAKIPEDVTITFASSDLLKQGTDAGTSNLLIGLGDGTSIKNVQIADDGTKTGSTCDKVTAVIGNVTQAIDGINGNDYYPVWFESTIPSTGKTFAASADQPKAGNFTFTFYNDDVNPNTPQAIGSGETKTMEIKLTSQSGRCFGNPTVAKKDIMCFIYGNDRIDTVKLKGATLASKPQSISVWEGNNTACYEFPVICDNDPAQPANSQYEFRSYVEIKAKSGQNPVEGECCNLTFSDVSLDYDADLLTKIVGVEDEDFNDIGVADINRDNGFSMTIS